MSRRANKQARRVEKKRKAAIRATKMSYRLGRITQEDRDEFLEFWENADAETVLRATGKARRDAADTLEATGTASPRTLRKLRREGGG